MYVQCIYPAATSYNNTVPQKASYQEASYPQRRMHNIDKIADVTRKL